MFKRTNNRDEEEWYWLGLSLQADGRKAVLSEASEYGLIQEHRRWWIFDFLSHPAVLSINGALALLLAPKAPDELMVGMLLGATLAAPLILGERRQVKVIGGPRRRIGE